MCEDRRNDADHDRAQEGRAERVHAEVRRELGKPETERERIGDERDQKQEHC